MTYEVSDLWIALDEMQLPMFGISVLLYRVNTGLKYSMKYLCYRAKKRTNCNDVNILSHQYIYFV